MYIVPLGGLGNRWRVLNSIKYSCDKMSSSKPDICVISIKDNIFNIHVDEVFQLPSDWRVIRLRGFHVKFVTLGLRALLGILNLFFNSIPKYGVKKFQPEAFVIATPHSLDKGSTAQIAFNEGVLNMSSIAHKVDGPYNAVHIRRGDNLVAVRVNAIEKYTSFIENSSLPVFICSDESELKERLRNRYKEKVFFYDINNDRSNKANVYDAVVDIVTCVNASSFLGSEKSSFSTLIEKLRLPEA